MSNSSRDASAGRPSFFRSVLRGLRRLVRPVYASPSDYWQKRYEKFDASLVGPGCIELDVQENERDYEAKWRQIDAMLSRAAIGPGSSLLDAGCGLGALTRRFVERGAEVTAIDFAERAVELARRSIGERVQWNVGPLDTFAPGRTFDAVVCIDVLFHITDDELHRRTVENLARLTAPEGSLIIQEHLLPEQEVAATHDPTAHHVRWRSIERYTRTLGDAWRVEEHVTYSLPVEAATKDLLRFVRAR